MLKKEKMVVFDYKFIMDSGFKRTEVDDEVYFSKHGFNYFIINKQITKNAMLDWNPHTKKVTLSITDDANIVISKRDIKTIDAFELFMIIQDD